MASLNATNNSAGAVTQLIAVGAMDSFISKGAKYTYWKSRHVKYTSFAMEAAVQPFHSNVQFGAQAQLTLNRSGDLCHYLYVCVELPGITACKNDGAGGICQGQLGDSKYPVARNGGRDADNEVYARELEADEIPSSASTQELAAKLLEGRDRFLKTKYGACASLPGAAAAEDAAVASDEAYAYWTNAIGQVLIKRADVIIGGATIDSLFSDLLWAFEETMGKAGKYLGEQIGKRGSQRELVADSRQKRFLWVPLPFWFARHAGSALSLASLQFHGVQISVDFESLDKCIIVSEKDTLVRKCDGGLIANSDLNAALETTYIYLDAQERGLFANNGHEALITQNQHMFIQNNSSQAQIQLNFNHPVTQLFFMVRRAANERSNRHFDYSGVDGRDPVLTAQLQLNNQTRFNKRGEWFRLVQPLQHCNRIPDSYVYSYSFALHPDQEAPSGSCNFSRIDHVTLTLQLQEALAKENVSIMVFARSLNVLRMRDGVGGLAFAS